MVRLGLASDDRMGRGPGRGGDPGVSWERGQRRRLQYGLGSRSVNPSRMHGRTKDIMGVGIHRLGAVE